ncbi:sensor histidine kinase [Priestia koreensis]|uniref:sensor histidine kinase n=1 Tax=Priestia koreensis TaxID=284581 RepID=UPI00203D24DB|nr:HAMP domain-containing histidine kinase [Priestia koreensis]
MRTLYLRIFLTTIFVMILSSFFAFFLSNAYYQFKLKPANDQKLTKMANDIKDFYEDNAEDNIDAYLTSVGHLGYQLYLVDEQKKTMFFGNEFRKNTLKTANIQSVLAGNKYHGIKDYPSKVFITGFFENDLRNTVGVPITANGTKYALFLRPDTELQIGELRIFLAVLLVLTFFISVLLVIISTRYIVKPITRLTEATKRLSKGDYNLQLNVNRRDEIGRLASHFSQMAKGLEQVEASRQEFVSNVSHEIQSPLSSIQGFSQTLQSPSLPEEERRRYLEIIEHESKRMSQLSKQLLTLASLDKEDGLLTKTTFDLSNQLKQVLMMTEWHWREKDIAVDMELPSTFVFADENFLHQVWTNLITNSIKFTEPGGTISLSIRTRDTDCMVTISDTGIGIAPSQIEHIFERFYKADKARDRKEASSGLGLAIVKKIIDLHEGTIDVKSELGKGTTFIVTFPRR